MKKTIVSALTSAIVLTLIVLSVIFGRTEFSHNMLDTIGILLIVCSVSAAYCFIAGEITHNYSQMDKLWSILPIAYSWITAVKGGFKTRLVVFAAIVTVWGVRLTFNFARKGAYRLRFWEGEEDYRWSVVKSFPIFKHSFAWTLFDLLFISVYQNILVLAICLPALACMDSKAPIGIWDSAAFAFALLFLALEAAADEYQWKFHKTKREMLSDGAALESLPYPFCLGFNTTGPWDFMRHPNYLGEQGFWMSLYFITIGSGVTGYYFFNWSAVGPLLLILLFIGSSSLSESISKTKYPRYSAYISCVHKYLPFNRFNAE